MPLQALGVQPGAKLAVFVGRLDPQKGIDTILEAARLLHSRRKRLDLHWMLVGTGPLAEWIRHRVGQLWLSDRVRLLGWRDDVPALLKTASVVVLPSRWEGMANVALEAMAAGTPLVASDVEGMRELAGLPPTIHLIPAESSGHLADAVAAVMDHPNQATRMARDAANRVRRRFGLSGIVEAYRQLYARVVSGQYRS